MGAEVGLDRLRGLARRISGGEHWDRLAIRRIIDDLFAGQRALTASALAMLTPETAKGGRVERRNRRAGYGPKKKPTRWTAPKPSSDALERTGDLSVAKLTLANSQIHELAER